MLLKRWITVDGILYPVVISDQKAALLAAQEAGRVIVGWLHPGGDQDLSPARYLVEDPDAAGEHYLERIVRRHYGWPWTIAATSRLLVREFYAGDLEQLPKEAGDSGDDRIFTNNETLTAYIRSQYGFFEYGIWAVIRKTDHALVGKAGVTGRGGRLELGYHIFRPYRKQGYATEACRAILKYAAAEFECPVYADTNTSNVESIKVLKKLGFTQTAEKGNPPAPDCCQYVWNC